MQIKYFLFVLLLFSFSVFAQHSKIPPKVTDSLSKLYPKATNVKWDKEGNDYEASFKLDNKDMSVNLNVDGKVLETETTIEISQLPDSIDKYVQNNYKGYKITEAAKIVKANGVTLFEAEIQKGNSKNDLLFDSQGKIEKKNINKEVKSDQEFDEDND